MPENDNTQHRRRRSFWWLPPAAVGVGAAALFLLAATHAPHRREAPRALALETPQPPTEPITRAAETATAPDLEATIMARLHAIAAREPATALGLALQGNARFPDSPDAAERGWIICRSLVELKRFPEAVAEARVVVEHYPNTPWAEDVAAHLLINPMSDPSERGYGHVSELE